MAKSYSANFILPPTKLTIATAVEIRTPGQLLIIVNWRNANRRALKEEEHN